MVGIPREIIEATSSRVGEMPPRDARRVMERAATQQPALLAYVMAATQDERAPVHELAIYLYFVVLQSFEAAAGPASREAGSPLPEVGMDAVESRAEANDEAIARLETEPAGFVEHVLEVSAGRQPDLLRYVVDALFARREEDPEAALDEDEAGFVFLILATVVDLLDEAASAGR